MSGNPTTLRALLEQALPALRIAAVTAKQGVLGPDATAREWVLLEAEIKAALAEPAERPQECPHGTKNGGLCELCICDQIAPVAFGSPNDGRWSAERLASASGADVLELYAQLRWRVAAGGTQWDAMNDARRELEKRLAAERAPGDKHCDDPNCKYLHVGSLSVPPQERVGLRRLVEALRSHGYRRNLSGAERRDLRNKAADAIDGLLALREPSPAQIEASARVLQQSGAEGRTWEQEDAGIRQQCLDYAARILAPAFAGRAVDRVAPSPEPSEAEIAGASSEIAKLVHHLLGGDLGAYPDDDRAWALRILNAARGPRSPAERNET